MLRSLNGQTRQFATHGPRGSCVKEVDGAQALKRDKQQDRDLLLNPTCLARRWDKATLPKRLLIDLEEDVGTEPANPWVSISIVINMLITQGEKRLLCPWAVHMLLVQGYNH